jgi:hypothetical protein
LDIKRASEHRLAGILRGYLQGEKWATEKRLEGEVLKAHSTRELREILSSSEFRYLHTIDPVRMRRIRAKFLDAH